MKIHDPVSATKLVPYAVMITTVVWSGMRPFSEFERRFRLRLQERAAIPTEAKNLIETFESELNSFVPEEKNITEVLNGRQGRLLKKEDFYDHSENLWFLMARLQYLYHLLIKYNREPVFSRLAERYDDEFKDLKTKMAKIHELATQRIADIHEMLRDEGIKRTTALSDAEKKALLGENQLETLKNAEQLLADELESATKFKKIYFQRQEKYIRSAVKKTSEEVVQLIVCGVLAVGRSSQHCRDLFKAFGLKQQNRIPNQLDTVVVTWVVIGALLITFVCSLVYYYAEKAYGSGDSLLVPTDVNNVLFWAIAASFMHLSATVGGYFCQRSLESGRERMQIGNMKARALSVRVQVAEALWSASFGFSLNIFILGALLALEGRLLKLSGLWWWALVPAVTAFFGALYTQKVERSKRQLNWLMWEQGLATGLVSLTVFYLLYSEDLTSVWRFGCYSTVTTVILGLTLGNILQKWVEGLEHPASKLGLPEQREGKRRRPLYKRAKWLSDKGEEFPARVLNISSSGAALQTEKPLKIETEGVVKIIGKKEQRARVVRNDVNDAHRIYVEFFGNAA